ncbi:MAG: 3-keto-disaccharide hydrolase [Flavisolibacter sp.]
MQSFLLSLLFASSLVSCSDSGSSASESENKNDTTQTASQTSNDWKEIFDGKTLNGWRTYKNKPADAWSVADGNLYCKGNETNKSDLRADLITTDQYENFELEMDWKISKAGNSGIMYLVTEEFDAAYKSGPEYQVIDDVNFPEKLENWQKTSANYAMDTAVGAEPNPVGEWNHTKIVVNKGHVEHWLNGKKVVEYELWTEDWKKKKTEGKWKDAPGYGLAKKGHIALQDHGSEAWFKNIRIREL